MRGCSGRLPATMLASGAACAAGHPCARRRPAMPQRAARPSSPRARRFPDRPVCPKISVMAAANASGIPPARSRASAAVGTPPRPRRAGHLAAFAGSWPDGAARRNAGTVPRPPAAPAPRPTPSTSQNTPNSAADRATSNTSKSRNLEANPSENLSSFLRGFVCALLSQLAPNAHRGPQATCCPSIR
jgi:hypothetical protein